MEWNDEEADWVIHGVMPPRIIRPGSLRYLPGKVPLLSRYRLSTIHESPLRERDARICSNRVSESPKPGRFMY